MRGTDCPAVGRSLRRHLTGGAAAVDMQQQALDLAAKHVKKRERARRPTRSAGILHIRRFRSKSRCGYQGNAEESHRPDALGKRSRDSRFGGHYSALLLGRARQQLARYDSGRQACNKHYANAV